jgi:hypothetical protein
LGGNRRFGFSSWQPGAPIPASGLWLLIGLAPAWSVYDLELMDNIIDRKRGKGQKLVDHKGSVQIGVFDVAGLHAPSDVEQYIPGLKGFFHTPVVGLWSDGQLLEMGQVAPARELIRRTLVHCSLTPTKHQP